MKWKEKKTRNGPTTIYQWIIQILAQIAVHALSEPVRSNYGRNKFINSVAYEWIKFKERGKF